MEFGEINDFDAIAEAKFLQFRELNRARKETRISFKKPDKLSELNLQS